MNKFSLKTGDTVKVLTGKDKSKTGKVVAVDYKDYLVTVEGINLHIRHERPRRQGQKGQKVTLPTPMSPSKLMLICPQCGKPTRVGHQLNGDTKVRICKKCKATI